MSKELLKKSNEIIRSFAAIIKRRGDNTNWDALSKKVESCLKEQHDFLNPQIKSKPFLRGQCANVKCDSPQNCTDSDCCILKS